MSEIGDMAFAITLNLNNIVIKKVYDYACVDSKDFFLLFKDKEHTNLKDREHSRCVYTELVFIQNK